MCCFIQNSTSLIILRRIILCNGRWKAPKLRAGYWSKFSQTARVISQLRHPDMFNFFFSNKIANIRFSCVGYKETHQRTCHLDDAPLLKIQKWASMKKNWDAVSRKFRSAPYWWGIPSRTWLWPEFPTFSGINLPLNLNYSSHEPQSG